MSKIFQQDFTDGSALWCHIQNDHYVLGTKGKGQATEVYGNLKTQEAIQDYIQDNYLCPNDFCQRGYIDVGYGERMACGYCNIY